MSMTREQKEMMLLNIKDLLDRLTVEATNRAREISSIKENLELLEKKLEQHWEAIQELRKTLVYNQSVFITPVPLSKDNKNDRIN